jgi:hypothetical protein
VLQKVTKLFYVRLGFEYALPIIYTVKSEIDFDNKSSLLSAKQLAFITAYIDRLNNGLHPAYSSYKLKRASQSSNALLFTVEKAL